jgi:hypothetical protein
LGSASSVAQEKTLSRSLPNYKVHDDGNDCEDDKQVDSKAR